MSALKSPETSIYRNLLIRLDRSAIYKDFNDYMNDTVSNTGYNNLNSIPNESYRVYLELLIMSLVEGVELTSDNLDSFIEEWGNTMPRLNYRFSTVKFLTATESDGVKKLIRPTEKLFSFLKNLKIQLDLAPYNSEIRNEISVSPAMTSGARKEFNALVVDPKKPLFKSF